MGIVDVVFIAMVCATLAAWAVTLRKFYPLSKAGHYSPTYNWLLAILAALLVWESLMLVAVGVYLSAWLATMLTVLWGIAAMSWLTISTAARTRRQVTAETEAAAPRSTDRPDLSRYTVRSAPPRPSGGSAARSTRVRRIQAMEA